MKHHHECPPAQLPQLRTPYNFDRHAWSVLHGLACPEPTRAQQQFKEECDINTIVKRFGLTGELPTNVRMPVDGDFTTVTDFQSAMNLIRSAQEAFMEFPASVRDEFANDPARMVAFVSDPKNLDRARALGIARPAKVDPPPPPPLAVRVVSDPEPSATPGKPGAPPRGEKGG